MARLLGPLAEERVNYFVEGLFDVVAGASPISIKVVCSLRVVDSLKDCNSRVHVLFDRMVHQSELPHLLVASQLIETVLHDEFGVRLHKLDG